MSSSVFAKLAAFLGLNHCIRFNKASFNPEAPIKRLVMLQIYFSRNVLIAMSVLVLFIRFAACKKQSVPDPVSAVSILDLESRLDNLRKKSNVPGMVAGIVRDGQVIWIKAYGYENTAQQKPVSNATIFHLASLTKTFASTCIIQLAHENKIDLNAPVVDYGVSATESGTVRVIHLLTHTSEGIPGSHFKYNGDRYALLSTVIQSATTETFHQLVRERITRLLGLQNTAPSDMRLASLDGFDTITLKQNTAQGYGSNGIQTVTYPKAFSTAAGLISNIDDMLKYAAAFDENVLLADDLKAKVFSPMISNDGKTLPYGLGWFIQQMEGIKITWHYGYWVGMSSMIIRVPEKKMCFVVMANSDMLSAPYPLGKGDIWFLLMQRNS